MPFSRSRSASVAMLIHPGPEPRRLGRLLVFFPLFLIAPGGSGLHEPRVLDMLADIGRVVLGAADDHGRIAAALYRRLDCLLRGLLRVRVRTPRRKGLPEDFKLTGAILRNWHTHSGAPSMCSLVCSILVCWGPVSEIGR